MTDEGQALATSRVSAMLESLVGQPFRGTMRRGWMEVFVFGPLVMIPSAAGGTRQIGRFNLLLECDWGLIRNGRVLAGFEDFNYRDPMVDAADPDPGPNTRRDRLLHSFLAESGGRLLTVVSAALRGRRDLDIVFDDGSVLEVRPLHRLIADCHYWVLVDRQTGKRLEAGDDVRLAG